MLDAACAGTSTSRVLALVFLLAAALLGFTAVRLLGRNALSTAEQLVGGLVVGWIVATTGAYLGARMAGALTWQLMLLVTSITAIGAIILFCRARESGCRATSAEENAWLIGALLCFLPIYGALFNTRMLQEKAEGLYSGGTAFYDLALHMAISTSFLYAQNFPPIYTLLPPEPALYPFLPDFLTAALVAGGLSFHAALCASGVALALAITALLYLFARRMMSSAAAAALATLLFLLNGGLGYPYEQLPQQHVQWTNIIVDAFLPQRASLFGISAALIVFAAFAVVWSNKSSSREWRTLFAAGVLTGTLPFFHTHSYLAIAIVSVGLCIVRPRLVWFAFWIPALLIALPHLLALAQHAHDAHNIRFEPGWLGHADHNQLFVWLKNIGLPALLIIPAWLSAERPWRRFYLPFFALLLVSQLVVFSPNDTDNLKLMFPWYAATCVLLAQWLLKQPRVVTALLSLGCVAPGIYALWVQAHDQKLMFTRGQIAAADFVGARTAPDALFLTAPELHQPLVSLAGRSIVRGNTAWLWSHGYDFRARESDVRRIYAAANDARDLLAYYAIDYIYLSDTERRDLRANEAAFDAQFPIVYDHDGIKIYQCGDKGAARVQKPAPREYASRITGDPAQLFVEFPQIAYFVYRVDLLSLGRPPRYAEFICDLRTLGHDLFVGASDWKEVLERNRSSLLEQRHVSRDAVENPALYRRAYDAAYLLMHYFGYLRRNPDDPPDTSTSGYKYWFGNLQRTHDYRSVSRAFLESSEYQQRPID